MHLDLLRQDRRDFPELDEPLSVQTLRYRDCGYPTLGPISGLSNLIGLDVTSYPDPSLAPLLGLSNLRYLRILHLPQVHTLEGIEDLERLEVLRLHTLPSWDASGRVTEVESLEPLAMLSRLRHLELFGVRPLDQSLRALERCSSLESVRVSKYPKAEVVRFRDATGLPGAFAPDPWF